jgi:hypothetical protein
MSSQNNTTNANTAKASARKLRNVKPSAKNNMGCAPSRREDSRHIRFQLLSKVDWPSSLLRADEVID